MITRVTLNEYDALNRLTRTTDPSSLITTYQYDAVGNLSQTTDPLGITTVYTYDARNLPTRADRSQSGTPLDSTVYAYDARGSLIDTQLTAGALIVDHDYAYNDNGQISESFLYPQHYQVQYGSPRVSMSRYFDNQTTGDGGLVYLQYFGNGWLERSESENFGQAHGFWGRKRYDYDGGGNRWHMYFHHPTWPAAILRTDTYSYVGNKIQSIVSCGYPCGATWPRANFGHDSGGNLNFEEWFDDGGQVTKRQSYEYDNAHRMVKLTLRDGRVMRFDYDHLGRLEYIRKPGGSLHFVYEDETHRLIREEWTSSTGQSYILAEYKWVNGRPHSFTVREGSNYNTYYYEYNWRGDVAFLRRPDGSSIMYPFLTGTLDYSMNLFGQNDNAGPHNRYRWNGAWGYLWIDEAGLYLIGQRWYHPDIGRWLTPNSPDYIYANNDPVNNHENVPLEGHNLPAECMGGYTNYDARDLTCWLFLEMKHNLDDPRLQPIRQLNTAGNTGLAFGTGTMAGGAVMANPLIVIAGGFMDVVSLGPKGLAAYQFRNLVGFRQPWDFKHRTLEFLGPGITLCYDEGCADNIEYSVPGNIHFGLVARGAGYIPTEVHAGAGLADIFDPAHNPYRAREARIPYAPYMGRFWPEVGPFGLTLNLGDEPKDHQAVEFGIRLYNNYGNGRGLSYATFQQALASALPALTHRPPDPFPVLEVYARDWPYWAGYFAP